MRMLVAVQKPSPAIGTLLSSVDDLPPGCAGYIQREAAEGLEPDDVPVRDRDGTLLTEAKVGPCRVVATDLPWSTCEALFAVERAPTRLQLARAIGAYRDPAQCEPSVGPILEAGWWAACAVMSAIAAVRLTGIFPPPESPPTVGGHVVLATLCLVLAILRLWDVRKNPAVLAELVGFLVLVVAVTPLLLGAAWLICELDGVAFAAGLVGLGIPATIVAACAAVAAERAMRRRLGLEP